MLASEPGTQPPGLGLALPVAGRVAVDVLFNSPSQRAHGKQGPQRAGLTEQLKGLT